MTDKTKKYLKGLGLSAAIIAFALALDLITKTVTDGVYVQLIPNFLYFTSAHNYNAAFSFDFGLPNNVFLVVVPIVTFFALGGMLFILVWIKEKHILFTAALSMIFSGALGNLIDRLAFGYVRDFIHVKYFGLELFGSTSFAIFNIADSALICGVAVMLVWVIFFYRPKEEKEKKDK